MIVGEMVSRSVVTRVLQVRVLYGQPNIFRSGAMVAQDPVKVEVAGSNPACGAKYQVIV